MPVRRSPSPLPSDRPTQEIAVEVPRRSGHPPGEAIALIAASSGSVSVAADLAHNLAEGPAQLALISAYVVHGPYSDERAERVVRRAMFVGGLVAIAHSIVAVLRGHDTGGIPLLAALLASLLGNGRATAILHRAWQQHGGAALRRQVLHVRLDTWGIRAAIVGWLGASVGLWFADPLGGIVVGGLMLWGAIHHEHDDG